MQIILLVLSLVLLPVIFLLIPRGNPLHEILHLPAYWWRLHRQDTSKMDVRRIPYGDHHRQYVLFIPPAVTLQKPDKLVVYFHGGGWKFGRPENFKASVLPFHEAGYPIVLPSHRRTPFHNYYDLREDLNLILSAVVDLQRAQGWEQQKIVLGGMSAGGNLAALLAYDQQQLAEIGVSPSVFAGLILCAAPLALEKMHNSILLRAFAGSRRSRQFQLANPLFHFQKHEPELPVFCIHGDRDGLVAFQSSTAFIEILQQKQPERVRAVFSAGGTHLEVAAWGHANDNLRREILSWLKNL